MVTPPNSLKNEQMMQKVLFCAKRRALGGEGICKRMSRGGAESLFDKEIRAGRHLVTWEVSLMVNENPYVDIIDRV